MSNSISKSILLVFCCCALLFSVPSNGAAESKTVEKPKITVPELIDLNLQKKSPNIPDLPQDTKSVNAFSHGKHANEYLLGKQKFSTFSYDDAFTCAACHHTSKDPSEIEACIKCKDLGKMADKVGGMKKIKEIYHLTCKKCHSKMTKNNIKTGPTRCDDCHKRKS